MSTALKLTPWFPASIKPVRNGFYDTNVPPDTRFSESAFRWYWDGTDWLLNGAGSEPCVYQNRKWRGVAK